MPIPARPEHTTPNVYDATLSRFVLLRISVAHHSRKTVRAKVLEYATANRRTLQGGLAASGYQETFIKNNGLTVHRRHDCAAIPLLRGKAP